MASKAPTTSDPDMNDYQAKDDARTLTSAAEIQNDTKRHKAAAGHLEKTATSAADAHKQARQQLERKTKRRMAKTFGNKKDTFAGEQAREASAK